MKLVIEEKDVGLEIDLNEVRAAIREHKITPDIFQSMGLPSVEFPSIKKQEIIKKKPGRKPGRKAKLKTSPPVTNVATQISGESAL